MGLPKWTDKVSDEAKDLCERGWKITLEEYRQFRGNTYDWMYITPYLSDEALAEQTANCLNNCQNHHFGTYDYNLQEVIVPELLRRLQP